MEIESQDETTEKTPVELYCRLPVLSLQKMSLTRVTTTLCNNKQLLRLIMKCEFQYEFEFRLYNRRTQEWAAVEAMAKQIVLKIGLCSKLNERILEFLWPVCHKIIMWKSTYAASIGNRFLRHFYWTDRGKIDSKRTAKYIIGNKNISVRKRFILACSVCLSTEIQETWEEMSYENKMYFKKVNDEKFGQLLLFWVYTLERSKKIGRRFMICVCACAIENGLLEALKYLYTISSKATRKEMLLIYLGVFYDENAYSEEILDIGYLLRFEISEDYERETMMHVSILELTLLLHFSDRENFLDLLEVKLESTEFPLIIFLLKMLFLNYHLEISQDDYYRQIFVHIWRRIPASMKKEIGNSSCGAVYLPLLVRDNFPFLLRKGASKKIAEMNSKINTSDKPLGFHRDKWEFLNFLIVEEAITIPPLKRFKANVMDDLLITKFKREAWNNLLRFVRKVGTNR